MTGDNTDHWGRRTFLKAAGAAGAATALTGVAAGSEAEGKEILIGTSVSDEIDDIVDKLPDEVKALDVEEALGFIVAKIESVAGIDVPTLESAIDDIPGVKYVEENAIHQTFEVTPSDPKFPDQYAPQQVNAPTAWDTTLGSSDVTVAVVDQGTKYDHPDLEAQFESNKGKDFVDSDDDPYPDNMNDEYHGTHVSGLVSATTDNGTGVAGVSNSHLLSVRCLSEEGSGSTADIAKGVRWAADQGADIINMSLGGGGYTETMKDAVNYALNNGTLPICAAGNDSGDPVSYPAAYDECIAVSALDSNENLADFSNVGPKVDLAGPGVDVLSTWTGASFQDYKRISGTSMACPVVSGVAALVKATIPDMGPNDLRTHLKDTAVDVGLDDTEQGAGRVDAANAVRTSVCGELYKRTEQSGSIASGGNASFAYQQKTDGACQMAVTLDGPSNTDFDLYVTLDGRTPTPSDYDRKSRGPGGDEKVVVEDAALSSGTELGILVDAYEGSGDYSLLVEEWGKIDNEAPTAKAAVSSTDVSEGEEVTFDASGSTDADDNIARYEWTIPQPGNWFSGSETYAGKTVTDSFGTGGDFEVTLTVVDELGRTDTDTVTVHVSDDWWPLW